MNDTHFKAWVLPAIGAPLRLEERPIPEVHRAGVLVRIESAMVLSYMDKVLDSSIDYANPELPFVPGTRTGKSWLGPPLRVPNRAL
jgi:alcohol dehydrogenase